MYNNILHKCVSFAASGHGIPVKIDKFKFAKWLKHLLDVELGKVEMQ
jgi:hypothetical protein